MFEEFFADPEFWVLVAFVVVVAGLAYKGFPLVADMLDERARTIRAELDEAARLRDEAQQALAEYQRKQRDAMKEAEEILVQARASAQQAAARAERDTEAAMERRRRMTADKIALEEANAITEVRNTAVDVAVAAVRRTLAQRLDPARKSELADEAIDRLTQVLN